MGEDAINEIIQSCTGGAICDFSGLYDKYAGLVRNVLFRLCEPADLDDLVQEVFLRVYGALPRFERGAHLKTWIYRIARNLALDDLRKRKQWKFETKGDEKKYCHEEKINDPEERVMNQNLVRNALKTLPEAHRSVLVLHCLEDLSLTEVADIVGIPEGTVKSRLHHAKRQMFEILKKNGVDL